LQKRIQNGDIEALRFLGDLYYYGLSGNEKNHDKAYPCWKEAADKGDAIAAGNVGLRLFDGVYGKERQMEAFPYLEIAAKHCKQYGNVTKPTVYLAHAYYKGIGCEKNKKKAGI
jgi:TPR repeat protein